VQNKEHKYDADLAHWCAKEDYLNKRNLDKISTYSLLKFFVYKGLLSNWTPEQISGRLKKLYPNNPIMTISHEAIYRHIYTRPQASLSKKLIKLLVRKKTRRIPHKKRRGGGSKIINQVSINNRPKHIEFRNEVGHWEGDLYQLNFKMLVKMIIVKEVMVYKLDNNMKTSLCTEVLEMAIKNRKYPDKKLIHHSDSRFQYCNPKYTEFAESNGIIMPMTEQYDPYENAIAERINRTLKYQYGLRNCIKNTTIAQEVTNQAVSIYNNLRTHFSLDLRKPAEVHLNSNIKYKSYRRNNVNLPELLI
jgi:IS30 family transposase